MGKSDADLTCDNCGAPVAVPEDLSATAATCNYCHGETPLSPALVQARYALHQQQLAYAQANRERAAQHQQSREEREHRRKMTTKVVLLVILLPIVVIFGIVGFVLYRVLSTADRVMHEMPALVRGGKTKTITHSTSTTVSIRSTYTCNSGTLTLRDRTFSAPTGPAVTVNQSCDLTLVDCTVSGSIGAAVNGGRLTIHGGSFATRGSAVLATNKARVTITQNATLTGESTITAGGGARVYLGRATVTGRHVAVAATGSARVRRGKAKITGRVVGDVK